MNCSDMQWCLFVLSWASVMEGLEVPGGKLAHACLLALKGEPKFLAGLAVETYEKCKEKPPGILYASPALTETLTAQRVMQ